MGLPKLEKQASRERLFYYFVVKNDGNSAGPFSASEILQMIAEKKLSYRNYCWRSGYHDWRPIISTDDFRQEFKGDSLGDPAFPHNDIPNEVERRFPIAWDRRSQVRKEKKVVVTFAKAKVKRISIYEWCFALLFSIGLAYFTTHWALTEVVVRVGQKTEEAYAGKPQKIGFFYSEMPLAEYAISPLMSAPAITQYQGDPIAVELQGQVDSTKSHLDTQYGQRVELDRVDPSRFWNPEAYQLDGVYQKPLHVRGHLEFSGKGLRLLVSHPGAPINSP